VAYGSDLKTVFAAVNVILASNPRVLKDPAALVAVARLDDSAINVNVMPWVAVTDFVPAGGEINAALLEAFRERGIVIPFPQREVRILGGAA
jgi:small conductance mechanosensitive channel